MARSPWIGVAAAVPDREMVVCGDDEDGALHRLAQAKAPWITWTPDTDRPAQVIAAMKEAGALDGTVGVFSDASDCSELT
jgi:hypothetical protein